MVRFSFIRRFDKAVGIGEKLFLTLFFLVFSVMGTSFFIFMAKSSLVTLDINSWVKTQCTVTESRVDEKFSDDDPFKFTVTYQYDYKGSQYTSSVYRNTYSGEGNYAKANQKLSKYQPAKRHLSVTLMAIASFWLTESICWDCFERDDF